MSTLTRTLEPHCPLILLLRAALGLTGPIKDEENERYYDGEDEFIDGEDDFADDDGDDADDDDDDVEDDDLD